MTYREKPYTNKAGEYADKLRRKGYVVEFVFTDCANYEYVKVFDEFHSSREFSTARAAWEYYRPTIN